MAVSGYLLDINVLIARVDGGHSHHRVAADWLAGLGNVAIATCPLTENGFVRIYGHPDYPGGPGAPAAARADLAVIRRLPGHRFVPDSITIDDRVLFCSLAEVTPRQVSDLYLLGLAVKNGLRFGTFDGAIPAALVRGGVEALEVIPG